uniref:Uncharacterized protein n=1 Tax=Romanomermis culicivorax TaxID=13658 RepID=A0A915IAW4_ROMCU
MKNINTATSPSPLSKKLKTSSKAILAHCLNTSKLMKLKELIYANEKIAYSRTAAASELLGAKNSFPSYLHIRRRSDSSRKKLKEIQQRSDETKPALKLIQIAICDYPFKKICPTFLYILRNQKLAGILHIK